METQSMTVLPPEVEFDATGPVEYSRTTLATVSTDQSDNASLHSQQSSGSKHSCHSSSSGIGIGCEDSNASSCGSDSNRKKLLIPDQSAMDKLLNFETEDDETDLESCASAAFSRQRSRDDMLDQEIEDKEDTARKLARVARDLAIYGDPASSSTSSGSGLRRRNSITVCETPQRKNSGGADPEFVVRKDSASSNASGTMGRNNVQMRQKRTKKKASRAESQRYSHHDSLLYPLPKKTIPLTAESTSSSGSSSRSTTPVRTSSSEEGCDSSGRVTPTFNDGRGGCVSASGRTSEIKMMESLHSEFMQSKNWAEALNTLDLSLDEVVHIRSVLTKAELESLPLDGSVKDDVEKGKICFLCMKTRFGLFTWGVRCQLCKQQVCSKCSGKMRIPLEHFNTFPAAALSGTNDEDSRRRKTSTIGPKKSNNPSKKKSFLGGFRNSAGSAPTSPESQRKTLPGGIQLTASQAQSSSLTGLNLNPADLEYDDDSCEGCGSSGSEETAAASAAAGLGPVSLPAELAVKQQQKKKSAAGKKVSREEELFGSLLQVCTDCREMILQVIRAQTTARRFQMTKNMFSAAVSPSAALRNEEVY